MKRSIAYRSVKIQQIQVAEVLAKLKGKPQLIAGIDISKAKINVACVSTDGEVLCQFYASQAEELPDFFALCRQFYDHGVEVKLAMEPTGVYGDVLRHQAYARSLTVLRVSAKKVFDSKELFDSVASQHDAKDAVVIGKLAAQGLGSEWKPESSLRREARSLIATRDLHFDVHQGHIGRLEAVVQRHFPELSAILEVYRSRKVVLLLATFGSPAAIAAHESEARALLGGSIKREKVEAIMAAAKTSRGVSMTEGERSFVRALTADLRRTQSELLHIDEAIGAWLAQSPSLQPLVSMLGAATTCALFSELGNPADYGSAHAFRKACGLNLRERSSGTYKGNLHITKRGPSRVRQYLHLAALRAVSRNPIVKAWYHTRGAYIRGQKTSALTAVTCKLALAVWHVAQGAPFDAAKLFDVRRLKLDALPSTHEHEQADEALEDTDDAHETSVVQPSATPHAKDEKTLPARSQRNTSKHANKGSSPRHQDDAVVLATVHVASSASSPCSPPKASARGSGRLRGSVALHCAPPPNECVGEGQRDAPQGAANSG